MKQNNGAIDVMQVMPDFGLAGAERMAEALSIELTRRGKSVVCVSLFDKHTAITEELMDTGIKVEFLNKKSGADLTMVPKLRRLICKFSPTVMHTHRYCMEYALPASVGLDVLRVHTVHNIADKEVPKSLQRLQRRAFRNGKVIPVAINETVQSSICKLYGLSNTQVPMVYNGISNSDIYPVDPLPGDSTAFTFLTIGRAEPQKNQLVLVKAFTRFHKKFSQTRLIIIGDGQLRQSIVDEIHEFDAAGYIFHLGGKPNASSYCYVADAFVLPSLYEGMPMTLIEAMQAGLPVLASRRGGSTDMVRDGEDGYLCNPDEQSIIDALTRIYLDPRREEIAAAGKIQGMKFTASAMADGYEKVYKF